MKVRDLMTANAKCIQPDASLKEAAEQMKALDVGSLPVCENDRLIGMITDRDITIRSVSQGHADQDCVRDAMTPQVFYCFEDEDLESAAKLMRERQIRRLPVLNREKRMVGIIALGDVAVESGNDELSGQVLEGVSEKVFAH